MKVTEANPFGSTCKETTEAEDRQRQDYELAMRARSIVGWLVGIIVTASIVSFTILAGMWIGLHH